MSNQTRIDFWELKPNEIVAELDKYIIGQNKAKKSVAIALRNRWRRQQVALPLREEIMPNNIILIGPTGVGKTEIARRLAKLAHAPFIKVEASKYTEVGYVGRDVESMIRDLTEVGISMTKFEKLEEVREKAKILAREKILDLLLPPPASVTSSGNSPEVNETLEKYSRAREKLKQQLEEGKLEKRHVEIDVQVDSFPMMQIFSSQGIEEMGMQIQDMVGGIFPKKSKKKKMTVPNAEKHLMQEEAQKLIDMDEVIRIALERVQNSGIVFIDEIDKVAGEKSTTGPDVSRQGVQRDLLPVVEGCSVMTKYGMVKTDHILFIASGAFHISKPSDLIPELQGRFPIRVELNSLTAEDFERILTEPENALIKQYTALLEAEGIKLKFTADGIQEIARIADDVNSRTENIGARRLHTVMTLLLEDIMFRASEEKSKEITINEKKVRDTLSEIVKDQDLSRYIL